MRPPYFNESFEIGEIFLPQAQVYGGALAVVVLGALYGILNYTWLGRAIRASAVNPQGAELVGVNVGAVAALTFAVGVASVGAGGSIVSVLYPFLPGSHYQWIARLLGIIVLGGLGSLPGRRPRRAAASAWPRPSPSPTSRRRGRPPCPTCSSSSCCC